MTNYILINAETRAPVPLPLPVSLDIGEGEPLETVIHNYEDPSATACNGFINTAAGDWWPQRALSPRLALITEEQFMAEREGHFPLCSYPECCEGEEL